jgi:hypothetical protein
MKNMAKIYIRWIIALLFVAGVVYSVQTDLFTESGKTTEEQTDGFSPDTEWREYSVESVPNPRSESALNWVCDPDSILRMSTVDEINQMLNVLEDSLSIEIAVVVLNSIGEEAPRDFAHELFNYWGVGKSGEDNGLLVLLTLDQRDITFETGYGLEGVLPDVTCFRIQQEAMVPWFGEDDYDTGMIEGIRTVVHTLYGSDYDIQVPEGSGEDESSDTPVFFFVIFFGFLAFFNWVFFHFTKRSLRPKDTSATAALNLLIGRKLLGCTTVGCLIWFVPLWPAFIAILLWYYGYQRRKVVRQSRTCPHCHALALARMSDEAEVSFLSPAYQCENKLGSAIHRVYRCKACGEQLAYDLACKSRYSCCPKCKTLAFEPGKWIVVKSATYTSEGKKESLHTCVMCHHTGIVHRSIPRKTRNGSSGSGGGSHHCSGGSSHGSFGGGHSGGGGSSSRF